ncbi:M23 family metallopeptidase [Paraclostridium sordellii]|uniref:M23 family metallopeptidase n=1 Tax=Paraclostridium sordellii TaxID=1505 RepID=UPI0005E780A1|nr:M23 family metallopeptidase [Paeniclostridium sordellii]CEP85723.1 cell wall endopeptidase [[Clostridium] sordellii] [Paeniclostridium sordellii]
MKKKKLLEKDGFYLALFVCVCLVAIGGVLFTKNSVDDLATKNGFVDNENKTAKGNEDEEIHLIEKDKDAVPTTTNSKENLEKAKEKEVIKEKETKLNYLGEKVTREYSEKEPTYSSTLDVWEIHKGLDVKAKKGSKVKSITNGKVVDIFKDDKHGVSVKVESKDKVTVVYSNLDSKASVEKNQEVKDGDVLGKVGDTSSVESLDGPHVHLTASKNGKSIDPMTLIK